MKWFQLAIMALHAIGFILMVYVDFNGREEKEPGGFRGFVSSVIATAVVMLTLYGAGAFSCWVN